MKDNNGAMNSLGTFLQIEMGKFNKLLKAMSTSLDELQRAIKGTIVMSAQLDAMYQALIFQRVPDVWSNVGYLSLKPLGSWIKDFTQRMEFMSRWIEHGPPDAFWMSAFFFPQGYMTAALQMYARNTMIAIDTLDFRTEVLAITPEEVVSSPKQVPSSSSSSFSAPPLTGVQGVYFYGSFVEGARWDTKSGSLEESHVGETHVYMPVIWLDPIVKDDNYGREPGMYNCPFYKVPLPPARHN
eukprot:746999-Hanusia_phi.AAC.2